MLQPLGITAVVLQKPHATLVTKEKIREKITVKRKTTMTVVVEK